MPGRDRTHSSGSISVNVQYLGKKNNPMGSLPQSVDTGEKERENFHGMTYILVVLNLLWRSFYFALMLEEVYSKKILKWHVLDKFF